MAEFLPQLLTILLACGVMWLVIRPLLDEEPDSATVDHTTLNALHEQKARCVQILKDLELDFATQKVGAEEYAQMKRGVSVELASLLGRLDQIGGG